MQQRRWGCECRSFIVREAPHGCHSFTVLPLCCGLFFDQSKDEEVNQQAMANLAEALLSPTGGLAKLDLEMNSLSIAAAEKLLPAMVPVIQAACTADDDATIGSVP